MAGIRVEVDKRVLLWAVQRTRAQKRLYRRFPRLKDWLEGTTQPTLRQVEEFARATSVPFGYLLLPEPPKERLPIPHFRTLTGVSGEGFSPELLDTVQTMQRRQDWMREYLIELGHDPLPFVGSASSDAGPRAVAHHIRETLGITADWASRHPSCWEGSMSNLSIYILDTSVLTTAARFYYAFDILPEFWDRLIGEAKAEFARTDNADAWV